MKNFVVFIFILWGHCTFTQNLITNPGFEEIDSCYGTPADIGDDVFEWSGCTGWSNPIAASSDLWCENPVYGNTTPPQLYLTYQYPRTGENMAGLLINSGIIFNYREYIQNELTEELKAGKNYDISFYVSGSISACMVNKYGLKFFSSQLNVPSALWLTQIEPDAVNDESQIVFDTTEWQLVSMKYTAVGGEKFAVIGNFQDSLSMTYTLPCDTSFWGGMTLAGGYYLIDDVSITLSTGTAFVPNVFSPNGDGINDLFFGKVQNCDEWQMYIINRWGNTLAVLDSDSPNWDGGEHPEGTYFYRLIGDACSLDQQGFFQLVR